MKAVASNGGSAMAAAGENRDSLTRKGLGCWQDSRREKLCGKVICSHGNHTRADRGVVMGYGRSCWGDVPHECTEKQINGGSRAWWFHIFHIIPSSQTDGARTAPLITQAEASPLLADRSQTEGLALLYLTFSVKDEVPRTCRGRGQKQKWQSRWKAAGGIIGLLHKALFLFYFYLLTACLPVSIISAFLRQASCGLYTEIKTCGLEIFFNL